MDTKDFTNRFRNGMSQILHEELDARKTAVCITVPKTIKWEDYMAEINDALVNNYELNFKVPTCPQKVKAGDRCYVCYDGYIRGWMTITSIIKRTAGFNCLTTGKQWEPGYYIIRKGEFHYLDNPVPMKGFMGYRYIKEV